MIRQEGTLTGVIYGDSVILSGGMCNENISLTGELSKPVGYTDYTGNYTVVPRVDQQIMPTKDKRMYDNVTITGVPISSTGNTSGGNTVYIAADITIE